MRRTAFAAIFTLTLGFFSPALHGQTPLTPEALLEMDDASWTETTTALFQENRVDEFIALCNESRARGVKNRYGESLLEYLYDAFEEYYRALDKGNRQGVLEYITRRMNEAPNDRTWPVLHAECLIRDAWMHRGSGWSYTVTEEGWKGFYVCLSQAHDALTEMLPRYDDDTRPHSQMVTVCMGLGRSEVEIYSHLRAAFRIEPVPMSVARTAAFAFLPRWLGDDNGAKLVRLAEWCVQQSSESCGDAMYLVVAARAASWDGYDKAMNEYGFSPERIVQASKDYTERVKGRPGTSHHAARLLCAADRRDLAAESFAALEYGDAASGVWSESTFAAWRDWSQGGAKPGTTPLHVAAQSGNAAQIERALKDGAAIDAVDETGQSAVQIAANELHWEAVGLLLDAGADPNVASTDAAPPLMRAVDEEESDAVKRLLDAGADPNVRFNGLSPLMEAVRNESLDTLSLLLAAEGIDINILDGRRATPLFRALNDKHYDAARMLLDAGADVHTVTTSSWTALAITVQSGDLELIKVIMDRGADPYSAAPNGWTAFHMAVFGGFTEIADYMLTKPGVTINKPMSDGWAPIHQASADGKPDMLAYVLAQKDVDVNLATPQEQTGLHLAARSGREKEVRMLLEAGADPSRKNSDGKTPKDLAEEKGHAAVAALLTP